MAGRSGVSFSSGKVGLRGYLYLPEAAHDRPVPCVVLCHGFSGTMDRLTVHAERFAAAGVAALLFDYRNFGESGGEPRQLVEIAGQQEDIRAAVAFVRSRAEIDPDRVALWGNSLGGGHVVAVAADDPRIAAVVAQNPYNGFPKRRDTPSPLSSQVKLTAAIFWDAIKGVLRLRPYYIPMVGGPGELAVGASEDAKQMEEFLTGGDLNTLWKNEVAPRALLEMARFKPSTYAPRVQAPLLVSASADDRLATVDSVRPLADLAPRGELRVFPGTHFDAYLTPALRDQALAGQTAFLQQQLAPVS
jgi:alpha-beta hydrolase superfamily lysophospholipase